MKSRIFEVWKNVNTYYRGKNTGYWTTCSHKLSRKGLEQERKIGSNVKRNLTRSLDWSLVTSIDVKNVYNVYKINLINAFRILSVFIILINATWNVEKSSVVWTWDWLTQDYMYKFTKQLTLTAFSRVYFVLITVCNEFCWLLHERTAILIILTNCENMQYKVHKRFETIQRLLTMFINVCYYFHYKVIY